LITLDYQTPLPPERKGVAFVVGRYTVGLGLGIGISCLFERQAGMFVCCGIYSVVPFFLFWLTNFVRAMRPGVLLEERRRLLTFSCGILTSLIEYWIAKWSEKVPDPVGIYTVFGAWIIMPIVAALVAVRRR
jgi:hypothetical protein